MSLVLPAVEVPMAAANAAAASFAALEAKLDYLDPTDLERVRQSYRYADTAHLGQMRHSGEPYITHPIAVAAQVAEWKLDASALMAALLHDTLEDCGVTKADLVERFGPQVAELVDGLTKLDKIQFNTREEGQAESFRKMLLAMARDVRVILVKIADRLHNMRTMGDMPRSKWGRIATETLEIYAPIAHRLGLNQSYRELQDLSFRHLKPWRYSVLAKALARARQRRGDLIQKVQQELQSALAGAGLNARIVGREKTLYSLYRKMDGKRQSFAQVNDLYGVRIILPRVLDCYTGLGVLHQMYKPVPGRFKDYIAIPKVNGYQSLHTTLVGPASVNIEFQLRTEPMDLVAEAGVAAHWLYKAGLAGNRPDGELGTQWLQSLLDIQNETRDAAEFWDHIKVDLFPDSVYVFTPRGQIMALPQGATTVDFAYAIHSNVGDHTVAAKVNNEQVPLRTELRNGDVVEIITAPVSRPNPAWLGFVRTGRARSRIRSHLKSLAQDESRVLGEKLLAQALRAEGLSQLPGTAERDKPLWDKLLRFTGNRSREEMYADIGLGKRSANMVAKRLVTLLTAEGVKPDALLLTRERYTAHENLSQGAVLLDGAENASVKYATCCRPIPGDGVLGYLGRGEGLVVHTDDCAVARRLQNKDAERFITVAWADEPVRAFEVGIVVTVINGKGVLARVAAAIAAAEADIVHMGMAEETAQDALDLRFVIGVRDREHLDAVLRSLRRTQSVLRASRSQSTATGG
ncbi:MAG TPA: bifunctional (p)ppGpp synthetase/guanosine-3',5'-bis(diphosphate) 3'-pyrophosphohydrolase [Ottowia sp.]|nr:bifunctional (p)ppGpp synthetase/guanosine-3',5'-bis(diphosphate) 3'-pyrophosphohydrolase [Ottowia sp.]HOM21039.1 bifunctional (p)ppGpp synthetase/guanosine-3',5'-bis(diphosphate) 3'-pyrophosphohydrolase [Ottowia sp.]HPP97037.1 bifunctional (p)ppGpp synthetase/guanosine-3',5'-bis(diphosphate) 3'-pyrophosphohydrolase [Ottowia sp.]HQZ56081.1 bifunctional (p)ppGpp synthetase/guanosine-3',5'-bis(diphosphate) 3'-pyrophosphohydrolase [Ottowia sp.]HRB08862.1 bifunctional (p)ppGpp synthetase/guanosi